MAGVVEQQRQHHLLCALGSVIQGLARLAPGHPGDDLFVDREFRAQEGAEGIEQGGGAAVAHDQDPVGGDAEGRRGVPPLGDDQSVGLAAQDAPGDAGQPAPFVHPEGDACTDQGRRRGDDAKQQKQTNKIVHGRQALT